MHIEASGRVEVVGVKTLDHGIDRLIYNHIYYDMFVVKIIFDPVVLTKFLGLNLSNIQRIAEYDFDYSNILK